MNKAIQTIDDLYSGVELEKAKNRQNHCSFEVAVIWGNQFSKKNVYHNEASSGDFFLTTEKNFISIF